MFNASATTPATPAAAARGLGAEGLLQRGPAGPPDIRREGAAQTNRASNSAVQSDSDRPLDLRIPDRRAPPPDRLRRTARLGWIRTRRRADSGVARARPAGRAEGRGRHAGARALAQK